MQESHGLVPKLSWVLVKSVDKLLFAKAERYQQKLGGDRYRLTIIIHCTSLKID
jgi:hypothetical protein